MHPSKRILILTSALSLCAASALAEPANLGLRSSQAENVPPSGVLAAPETESIDWSALNWDASKLSGASANITARKSLPSAWQGKVGVDANASSQPSGVGAPINPDSLLPGAAKNASDAAWAKVTAPGLDAPVGWDKTTFDARFDPVHEERKLGTTLSKSVPLNERFSVTLQNGYSMTQTPSAAQAAAAVPHAGHDAMSNHYATDNAAKLNVLPTGTALSVGTTMSTTDEKWRRSVGAEQNLFGGISVKGAVTESATAGGAPDRSLTAGFKRNW
ncbi:MAG TPA: hypothetical protein VJL90_13990 [Pseudorhodoplanes sp.]|nr:hypothetical protein [Pseudorhodoplanes sp.]